jgi:hypothetical protein
MEVINRRFGGQTNASHPWQGNACHQGAGDGTCDQQLDKPSNERSSIFPRSEHAFEGNPRSPW